ncbi:replication termination factor 2 [Cylas formicarius]|uniref:replication termination factor 2 n=1 Tax=Cylas formicarius TaxID=197179 RepID=UPI002958ADB1|nr:replication termination factor 2 [Cylas formicarius]XP_060531364.1 replication termination factor 2 [Cylas formicarius]
MGCDGGTIPRRDELVRIKKKPESKDKDAELAFLWKCCAITQELLQEPVVVCHLGKLYNKMALIEALLDRSSLAEEFRHIRSLKDVKDLNLTKNPEYKDQDKKNEPSRDECAPYICPVLGLEMGGKFRFVALWSCGCVFSERAYKEVNSRTCHKCNKTFEDDDVVVLNGTVDDLELMKKRMLTRQRLMRAVKDKRKINGELQPKTMKQSSSVSKCEESKPKKIKLDEPVSSSRIGNVIATGKVSKAEELRKMKPDYSIAKDKKATDVYKSIFTSHKSEKEQDRAHWVTYNPFYN